MTDSKPSKKKTKKKPASKPIETKEEAADALLVMVKEALGALFEDSRVKTRFIRLDLSGDPRARTVEKLASLVGIEVY